jgi:hypothetical protein
MLYVTVVHRPAAGVDRRLFLTVWPVTATVLVAVFLSVLATIGGAVTTVVVRMRRARSRVDAAAPHMGRGRDIAALSYATATATAARLGVAGDVVGLPIAATVAGGRCTRLGRTLRSTSGVRAPARPLRGRSPRSWLRLAPCS